MDHHGTSWITHKTHILKFHAPGSTDEAPSARTSFRSDETHLTSEKGKMVPGPAQRKAGNLEII